MQHTVPYARTEIQLLHTTNTLSCGLLAPLAHRRGERGAEEGRRGTQEHAAHGKLALAQAHQTIAQHAALEQRVVPTGFLLLRVVFLKEKMNIFCQQRNLL